MSRQRELIDKSFYKYQDTLFCEVPAQAANALLDFQRAEFCPDSRQQDETFNRWMYQDNSANRRIYCLRDEQVVGQQSAIAMPLSIKGKILDAACAIDLRVRPEWKMKGLGVALIGALMHRYPLLIGLGISDEAYTMFKRQGWQDMGQLDYMVKPISFRSLDDNDELIDKLKKKIATLYSLWSDKISKSDHRGYQLSPISEFSEAHADLYHVYTDNHFTQLKTLLQLQWRYTNSPRNRYQCLQLTKADNRPLAMLIARRVEQNGRNIIQLSEVVCENKYGSILIVCFIAWCKQQGIDLIIYQGLESVLNPVLKARGFIKRSYGSRFMFYTDNPELSEQLRDKSRWRICFSDSDMDF